jgi:hypothetical protein
MKYATRIGRDVFYWGKPPATAHKKHREPVLVGSRVCKWKFCAFVRAWLYEII